MDKYKLIKLSITQLKSGMWTIIDDNGEAL